MPRLPASPAPTKFPTVRLDPEPISMRLDSGALDVEFPTSADFSTTPVLCDRAARSRHFHPRGSRTSLAALAGSVSPSPYAGHKRATGQAPHAGFRA